MIFRTSQSEAVYRALGVEKGRSSDETSVAPCPLVRRVYQHPVSVKDGSAKNLCRFFPR